VFLFAINNILPFNLFTYRILYIGFSLEALLFGWAIGDKYNEIQKDKEKIQLKNIVLVKEQKQVLEKTVEERTHELQSSNEELQVMNEELSQTQEELQTQRDFLDDQNITLQSQNKQIQDSIRAAELIQKSILPYQSKLENLLQDYFILNRPKDVVSGDFYWVHEHNDEIILVVADCTGHGVPGAFMTLIGSSLLDKIVETWQITSPNLILKKLDEEIKARLYQENAVYNLGGMDAVVINFKKESIQTTITFSGAKNNLLYFHSKDKEFHEVKATRKSIGAKDNNTKKFENTIINLPTGSTLYLGTDGLQDQNNTKRKRFGSLRLKQTFEAYSNLPLDEQKTKIEATLDEYMKGTSQRDDILWLGLRV
jgi:serine phosphatase RsbU (regulator of sigma subunit)